MGGANIGGIASKLGNRYEAKWLVLQFLDVIGEKAAWLQFEGIGEDFIGFEFAVHRMGRTEWHQTKLSAPRGNWTIGALGREGVLTAFKARLTASHDDVCVFVSQDPTRDLRELTSKACRANRPQEFETLLTDPERNKIAQLEDLWGSDRETTILWLRRCEARTIDEKSIDSATATFSDLYFHQNDGTFAVLRDYLEEQLNKVITTATIRAALKTSGRLSLKHWSLDPTLEERLAEETRAYLDTYTPFGAGGGSILRKEVSTLAELLTKPDGPVVILVTGTAGSGKSGVVRGLVEYLLNTAVLHLAFRVDHHLDCRSPQEFGRALAGRNETPAATLKGLRPAQRTVLLVDQVDAISEVSGRSGTVREAVLRLVDHVRNFDTVRLVLVCRSFDLESDSRLKALKDEQRIQEITIPLLDWKVEVEPFLEAKGIKTNAFSQGQRELLRLPLNLSVFLEVADDASSFATRSDLFDRLLQKKEASIRVERNVPWAVIAPLAELAKWMSDRQRLDAPETVLMTFPGALDLLASEHLIVRSRRMVNFFHESFFDHVYAHGFIMESQTLCDLLTSTEQHLFRRTQTRQILEALRQSDRARYHKELENVLASPHIRYHIKSAVAQWLGSLADPTSAEATIVRAFDARDERFRPLVRLALLGSPGWFDCLLRDGWILAELNGTCEERRQHVFRWLSAIAAERPGEVATLLEGWWGNDNIRGSALLDWLGYVRRGANDRPLASLCEKVINSKPEGRDTGALQRRELLLATWVAAHSSEGAGILRALFDAWFDAHPGQHPFERDALRDIDLSSLKDTAKKSPKAFLEGASIALVRTIDIINERSLQGTPDYSFSIRSASGERFGAEAFLHLYRSSLGVLAETEPQEAQRSLSNFDAFKSPILLHLHLETIAASKGSLADQLLTVLDAPSLCDAGWDGAGWKSFAEAVRACFLTLSERDRARVEAAILALQPELAFAKKTAHKIKEEGESQWCARSNVIWWLNRSGCAQWGILETLDGLPLSTRAHAALETGRRKFRDEAVPRPLRNEVGWVQSPIDRKRAAFMTDKQWLRAMRRYNTEDGSRRSFLRGGASQLGGELQHFAKSDPARFASLIQRIPDDANPTYIDHILWGLAETDAIEDAVLTNAVTHAHSRPAKPHGGAIVRIFEKHPTIARMPELLDILTWHVENGEANTADAVDRSHTERQAVTIEDLLEQGGRLYMRGINGTRGAAAEALGEVLWQVPDVVDRAWELLDKRISQEALVSVRCCLVRPLVPLFNSDRSRCTALFEKLATRPEGAMQDAKAPGEWLSPLVTREGTRLLPFILDQVPEVGRRLVNKLLDSGSETLRLIGIWHVLRQSFHHLDYREQADAFVEEGPRQRQLAADLAAGAIIYDEFRDRAEQYLVRFFEDDDADVQRQAADVFRNIAPADFHRFKKLASTFLASKAFGTDAFALLHRLGEATCDVDDLVIEAATLLVADLDRHGAAGGRKASELHQLQALLQLEYAASEANEPLRKRLLDVIDMMLSREMYGTEAILKAHERS